MQGRELVMKLLEEQGISYSEFARRLGYKTPSGVRGRLKRQDESANDLSIENLTKYLDALGYEVVAREKGAKKPKEFIIGK